MRLRLRLFILVSVFLLITYILYATLGGYNDLDYLSRIKPYLYPNEEPDLKPIVGQAKSDPRHQFWDKIFDLFNEGKIDLPDLNLDDAVKYVDPKEQLQGAKTEKVLLSKAVVNPEVHNALKAKHALVMNKLPKKLDKTTYKANSNGVVLIGGARFSWLSYLSLLSLRKTGCNLPVEVIMPLHDDFVREREFCTQVLPRLNAACVVLPDVLGASVMNKWSEGIAKYQFKSLALMVSSFQNVLLLDSDNVILENPEKIFQSELFKTYGMVTWPDYWERTISPEYYEIADIPVNSMKRLRYNRFPLALDANVKINIETKETEDNTPYHDLEGSIPNLSTESGQFLINKETHSCTLLLSMYYNMLGPKLYYKLFSLGEQGEGDKDTFPAAAFVCKDKFYQLKSFILTLGYVDHSGNFQGVAMGQKNPLTDYEHFQANFNKFQSSKEMKALPLDKQIENIKKIEEEFFSQHSSASPLFTIHCNYPKLDPLVLMGRDDLFDLEQKRLKYRMYGGLTYKDPIIKDKTLDFELEQWKNMGKALCEDSIYFVHLKDYNMEEICEFINNQIRFLQSS